MTNWQLSERPPALVAHPPAVDSLDEAHAAIEQWEYYSKKRLDAEQKLSVELMMAETADGRWAADTTGRAQPRQNGKGDEIEAVELWGLVQRGEVILHTAHEAATAASAHRRMVALVEGHRDLSRLVAKKSSWNGNLSLWFTNGAEIVWRTRTGAGGRGLDDISRIVIDEAQHAQPEELASSTPTLAVNPNPQKNFVGSGGVKGKSGFWWQQRLRALDPSGRFAWLEHSAETVSLDPDGQVESVVMDVATPAAWERANPAYPSRISHDYLLDQLLTLGTVLFGREHACVWDPPDDAASGPAFNPEAWAELEGVEGERPSPIALAVEVSHDRKWSHIGLAGRRKDGGVQLEIVQSGRGTGWVADRVRELQRGWRPTATVVNQSGPAGGLVALLEGAGCKVNLATNSDYQRACGLFADAFDEERVAHAGQRQVAVALGAARKKWTRDRSGFVLVGSDDSIDIAPLRALVLALAALESTPKKSGRSSERRAVVM